jgi:uncharacterized membrane protein YqjE
MAVTGPGPADSGAEKREQGTAISFIGLAVLVVDLLVVFFAPAAFRVGRHIEFLVLIAVLAVIGFGLIWFGRARRRTAV